MFPDLLASFFAILSNFSASIDMSSFQFDRNTNSHN
jgi:hypothetical protein